MINHIEVAFDQFVGLNANSIGKGREYTEFDRKVLLRSAFREKIEGLARAVQTGIHSPDEARYELDLGAVPGGFGKMPRVQQQMVPLDFEPPEPVVAAPPAAAEPEAANDNGDGGDTMDAADEKALARFLIERAIDTHATH
jgi:hypothetical protein